MRTWHLSCVDGAGKRELVSQHGQIRLSRSIIALHISDPRGHA
jgi:hypothetical protein